MDIIYFIVDIVLLLPGTVFIAAIFVMAPILKDFIYMNKVIKNLFKDILEAYCSTSRPSRKFGDPNLSLVDTIKIGEIPGLNFRVKNRIGDYRIQLTYRNHCIWEAQVIGALKNKLCIKTGEDLITKRVGLKVQSLFQAKTLYSDTPSANFNLIGEELAYLGFFDGIVQKSSFGFFMQGDIYINDYNKYTFKLFEILEDIYQNKNYLIGLTHPSSAVRDYTKKLYGQVSEKKDNTNS